MEENKIKEELEREVNLIVEEINNLDDENISKFLENAIDTLIIRPIEKNEVIGFNILLTTGNPNIMFIYNRGSAFVIGFWGNAEVSKSVNIEKADMILEYLNELIKIKIE